MNNWDRRKFSDIKSGPYVKRESRMKPVINKLQFEYFWEKFWEIEKILRIFEKNGILHRMLSVTFHSQDFQKHRKFFHIGVNYLFHCIKIAYFLLWYFSNAKVAVTVVSSKGRVIDWRIARGFHLSNFCWNNHT